MKRLLAFLAVLVVGVVVGRLSKQAPASAEGGGGSTPSCADLNGDGAVDMSDSIHLIKWLFAHGPAPVCPPLRRALPATGQTKCYDDFPSPYEMPCTDPAACPGQDGLYQAGCPRDTRFVDNGDGTVTDTCTGLMWQQVSADVNDDQQIDPNDQLQWCAALAYCEDLSFAGHDDWRLPNIRELLSIVDYGRRGPAIDSVFGAVSSEYWSSTSRVWQSASAWCVAFNTGAFPGFSPYKDYRYYVRAVRTIQPGE